MNRQWWRMPGPSRYASGVVDDLRDGKNVILLFPEHAPGGLLPRLKDDLNERDGWRWGSVRISDEEMVPPVDLLFNLYVPDYPHDSLRNIRNLARESSFQGRVIWLEDIPKETWGLWKILFEEFAQACDALSVLERTIFVVFLSGELSMAPPREGPRIAHHRWQDASGRLDSHLFAALLVSQRDWNIVQKRIAATLIADVALWDPTLMEMLSGEKLERIHYPFPVLEEFAKNRGWDFLLEGDEDTLWSRGVRQRVDGSDRLHSAFLAIQNLTEEIRYRIWTGQVGVLLPLVEEKRREFLSALKAHLKVPFRTRFGEEITNIVDLEIGHIESQITGNGGVDQRTQEAIRKLRKIRNHLSHLEPVPPDLALSEEIM